MLPGRVEPCRRESGQRNDEERIMEMLNVAEPLVRDIAPHLAQIVVATVWRTWACQP